MFSMLTLCIKHIPNINQDYGIDTEVLHSGIVPKPKLWYRAIPRADSAFPVSMSGNWAEW